MISAVAVLIAVLLDSLLGEPRRWHPLALFGRWASGWEGRLYGGATFTARQQLLRGGVAWILSVLPLLLVASLFASAPGLNELLSVLLLYLALGGQSLVEHARRVSQALQHQQLDEARQRVGMMVSRDTQQLDEVAISKATVESLLENGNDAIFAALFWFMLLGIPGVVLYRLSNTLDAMWGYKNARYLYFGRFAARIDDGLNWLPARLTALTYTLMGNTRQAWLCWQQQARSWDGVNPGVVMASGAGALLVRLGGEAVYHGKLHQRPQLGAGHEPRIEDIERAIGLVQRGQWFWVLVIVAGGLSLA